jgi:hypothetical protein
MQTNDNSWTEIPPIKLHQSDTLTEQDTLAINIIENIYGMVSIGMNFSMKIIGFDQFVKRYCGDFKQESKNVICGLVPGYASFIEFPRGMINYHYYNQPLFNLSTIALMLCKISLPINYIDELSNRINQSNSSRLFQLKRTSGLIQPCAIYKNSSVVYRTKKDTPTYWELYVSFDDQNNMTPDEIAESNQQVILNGEGTHTKRVDLCEFMQINSMECITFNVSQLKRDLIEVSVPESNYGDKSTPDFVNKDSVTDVFLISNIDHIHDTAKQYFIKRLDDYIVGVTNSFKDNNIQFKII